MPWRGRQSRAEGGASSRPRSSEHGPRRVSRSWRPPSSPDGAHDVCSHMEPYGGLPGAPRTPVLAAGRMEWRVEGPRHRPYDYPSAYRCLPIQQVRYRECLWGAVMLLSLFAGAVTATPEIWHHNQTLKVASYGSEGLASPASIEDNSREAPSLTAWNHWHGDNVSVEELSVAEPLRAERSPPSSRKAKKGSKKAGRGSRGRYCRSHNIRVKVRDLGLGFESDEIVMFKYCSGSCHRARTNYDLTLSNLLRQRAIIAEPHDRPASHPCCRPTRYEAISFMDVRNAWRTVDHLSAAECSCVG